MIIGSAALTALTALVLAGPSVVVISPFLVLPFAVSWILRPLLGELGWPGLAVVVTTVAVGLLGCYVYWDAFVWHPDAQSALVMLFIPLYQVGTLGSVTFLTVVVWAVRSGKQGRRSERR